MNKVKSVFLNNISIIITLIIIISAILMYVNLKMWV